MQWSSSRYAGHRGNSCICLCDTSRAASICALCATCAGSKQVAWVHRAGLRAPVSRYEYTGTGRRLWPWPACEPRARSTCPIQMTVAPCCWSHRSIIKQFEDVDLSECATAFLNMIVTYAFLHVTYACQHFPRRPAPCMLLCSNHPLSTRANISPVLASCPPVCGSTVVARRGLR